MKPTDHLRTHLVLALALVATLYLVTAQAAPAEDPPPVGLVLQDQVALRGAARESAPAQAQLWRGEALEIRGERLDYYQVWDYRRERGGYLRKSQLQRLGDAPELLAQLRLVRQQPGAEALGLGLAAAYVQAASPEAMRGSGGADALDALGSLAERLADRASAGALPGKSAEAALAGHLDVAGRYGLKFVSIEQAEGQPQQLCYDGDAFRRLLTMAAASPEQRARAALSLTRPECGGAGPRATPREREQLDDWRAEVLAQVPLEALPAHWRNRVLMRRSSVWSALAFARLRRADATGGNQAARQALADFAGIRPAELAEDDLGTYNDAAMRGNAVRWAAQAGTASGSVTLAGGLRLDIQPGASAGETCVSLVDAKAAAKPLVMRCSWGLVAPASASVNREGSAVALAVQPLDGWRELWLLRKGAEGWRIDVLPPAAASPGLGYAEFAGWVPGGRQLLVAREARAEGRYRKSFELLNLDTLATERQAGDASLLGAFQRWQDAGWKGASLSLR